MRLVAHIQADLDPHEAVDPLLPEVAWSWLVDALADRSGTCHRPGRHGHRDHPVRYGDISGLRAPTSWRCGPPGQRPRRPWAPTQAFCEVLEHAAGLPPAGVTDLNSRSCA